VAWNLERARRGRGWTQTEAARALEPYLGYRLSRAAFSQAERSVERRDQIRRFDADEIVAFARAFNLTVGSFFSPPEPHYRAKRVVINGKPGKPRARVTSKPLSRGEMTLFAMGATEAPQNEEDRRRQEALMARLAEQQGEAIARQIRSAVWTHLAENPEAPKDIRSGGASEAIHLRKILEDASERAMRRTAAEEQKAVAKNRANVEEIFGPDKPFDQAMLEATPGWTYPARKRGNFERRGRTK